MTIALMLLLGYLVGFDDGQMGHNFRPVQESQIKAIPGRFNFVRVRYDSEGGYGESWYTYQNRDWERWETDYPDADENFLFRLSELTTLDPNPRSLVRRLSDKDIFEFPFLYFCDVGWMVLNDVEKSNLRDYLNRGGFVWVDDFWGDAEWDSLENAMKDVFPDLTWKELPLDHPVFNMVFPLKGCPQVPARVFAVQGWTTEPEWIHKSGGVEQVHCRGYFDKDGRLMLIATHNTDIGDGFEREGEGEWYFNKYSTKAYALGVNIVVYALTH